MKTVSILKTNPSEFTRNILTLFSGTAFAQTLPILVSPLLTRIYSPEEFGIFALYFVICVILGGVSNLKYDMAIVHARNDNDALDIARLAFAVCSMFAIICFIAILFFSIYFSGNDLFNQFGIWIYSIPLTVFSIGLFNVLNYVNSRNNDYSNIARCNIIRSIALVVGQLTFGIIGLSISGLILGYLLSNLLAYILLFFFTTNHNFLISAYQLKSLRIQALEHKEFLILRAPGSLVDSLSQNMASISIIMLYSSATLGLYHLVQRVLGAPSAMVGGAIAQVYYQQATKEKHINNSFKIIFTKTLKNLLLIAVIIYLPLILCIERIITIVFGSEWLEAGKYAQILIPMFLVRFIVSPLTFTFIIQDKQKNLLLLDIIVLISVAVVYLASYTLSLKIHDYLQLLSATLSFIYFAALVRIYMMVNREIGEHSSL